MILPAAALVLTLYQPSKISYRLMITTEVRSPVSPSGVLIRDRRRAYEFFGMLKAGANKPLFLKNVNWSRQNVLVLYPGFIQKDARAEIEKIVRRGNTLHAYVQIRRGITAETFYPAMLLTVAKQPRGMEIQAKIKTISMIARSR